MNDFRLEVRISGTLVQGIGDIGKRTQLSQAWPRNPLAVTELDVILLVRVEGDARGRKQVEVTVGDVSRQVRRLPGIPDLFGTKSDIVLPLWGIAVADPPGELGINGMDLLFENIDVGVQRIGDIYAVQQGRPFIVGVQVTPNSFIARFQHPAAGERLSIVK